jgi:amino acid transporter
MLTAGFSFDVRRPGSVGRSDRDMTFNQIKAFVLGRRLATDEAEHQLLPKRLALPVFASDPLSSVAYATEEMMLVLALAGAGALWLVTPVSGAVAVLLAIVIISYRQTIRAYPDGGGAFIVASENIGLRTGAVAASALLVDYTLTVAVSVAAGVAAITSAIPALLDFRVAMALVFVILITVANLRGVKEASSLFAIPTYLFVVTVMIMLVTGFIECSDGTCPQAPSAGVEIEPELVGISLFLILRAFASGSTALTGVEAIANGVQAFREPRARNAAATLTAMGVIAITMFLGISTLARLFGVRVTEETIDTYGTVISQIGRTAFHGGVGFWLLQVFTAGILILAANTAYQDFPRLSAILADHRLLPRQFRNRGDRLVFSNGVVVLALLASLLIIVFDAEVTRLIQLYVVGVFTSFTLSQAGMVRHWLKTREPGWQRSVVLNAVGSVTTGVVLIVVATVKFTHGAWIVIIAIPIIVATMMAMRRHYQAVAAQLRAIPVEAEPRRNRVIVLVNHADEATDRALTYVMMIPSVSVECVHAEEAGSDDVLYSWRGMHPDHPLTLLEGEGRSIADRVVEHIVALRDRNPDDRVTVVMSERFRHRSMFELLRHRHSLAIKARLLFEPNVVLTDLTLLRRRRRRGIVPIAPRRLETVVLISDLTRPVREALTYAISLGAPVTAVHVDVDERQRLRVLREWPETGFDMPLEFIPSPYRAVVQPLVGYLRERRRIALPGTIINVVIPEFVVPGRVTQFLHNQTGLAIKGVLAPEPGIAVTSVPFHLAAAAELAAH